MMRRQLTGNEAAQAVGMLQAGQVQRAVAGHFNVSQSVISRYRKLHKCLSINITVNSVDTLKHFVFDPVSVFIRVIIYP
jgi:hypothetical protein